MDTSAKFSRSSRLICLFLILAGVGWISGAAYAQSSSSTAEIPVRHRLVYQNLFAGRHNPWGLVNRFALAYQYRLYRRRGILWDSAYVGLGITPSVTPASIYLAASVEVTPIAFLQLRVFYGFYQVFRVFRGFQSFSSPTADFSDEVLRTRGGVNRETSSGGRGGIAVLLQGKVGPFAVRNDFQAFYYYLRLRQGDSVFYDIFQDALVASPGWLINNDSDLLYLSPFRWISGLRATVIHSFYPSSVFQPGESTKNPTSPYFRLGPILGYTFRRDYGKRFQEPTIYLQLNWNVFHPNRAGQSVSQAIPTTFLAFTFTGELWSNRNGIKR